MTKTSIPAGIETTGLGAGLTLDSLLHDQQAGRSLQEQVRPRSGSVLQGISFEHEGRPDLYLSGDALDFFTLPDGRILAYLLDISGHGTAAALLAMYVKSCVRHSLAMRPASTAAQVLADVNRSLLDADMRKYGTMICLIFTPQENSMQWSHAGHTPRPVFWDGVTSRQLDAREQPVGLFPDAVYVNYSLALPAVFALCLCSDGVLETLAGEDLSSREASLVDCVELYQGCFSELESVLNRPGPHLDDRTVFVISRLGHE